MSRSELPTTSGRRYGPRRGVLAAVTGLVAIALALLMIGGAGANPVTGAVNTTDDPNWSGPPDNVGGVLLGAPTQACLNGGTHSTPAVNCNIYLSKTDVFLSGSPSPATPGAGTYFFAVLVPGGQPDPNDGGAKNLSDTVCDPYATCPPGGTGDLVTNREFSIDGSGNISPLGGSTHAFDARYQEIQVAPYDDTTNPGGVYILATCKISDSGVFVASVGTVDPRDCKYDAFKVQPPACAACGGKPPAADLSISKDATPALDREFAWSITKGVDKTHVDLDGSGTATFNYTVNVTHDPGTLTNWKVTGTITILNFNDFAVSNLTVSDDISDDTNDSCSITDGVNTGDPLTGQTVPAFVDPSPGLLSLSYTCTWAPGAGPAANMEHNTARVDWPDTPGSADTADLPAGHADFTLPFTFGTPNPIDNCADVSDTFNGGTADGLAHVCANNTPVPTNVNPHSLANFALSYLANTPSAGYGTFAFTYSRSISFSSGTLGSCTDYKNTASETDNSSPAVTHSADKTVNVCFFGPRFTPGYWKNHLGPNGACPNSLHLPSGTGCSANGPWVNQDLTKVLGTFPVTSISIAAQIWSAMSCSFSGNAANQNQQAIGCLAGHLLSAKYNRNINKSDPCIDATIAAADAFLVSLNYTGPSASYTGITLAQRNTAIALKTSLDNYDNGGFCHT